MTRLFLRFYLGVIIILVSASLIQTYVMWYGAVSRNTEVFQQMNFGGFRLARDRIAAANPEDYEATMKSIQEAYDYPVKLDRLERIPRNDRLAPILRDGEPIILDVETIAISFDNNKRVLLFGPVPQWVGPNPLEIILGLGIVLLFAAMAMATLLRPVVRQLNAVERTATAIAGGDLSARIQGRNYKTSVPIAAAFNTMADRTESLLKSQRELLQAVSHELRTPLARIRFATELIETAKTDDERKKRLESVDKATEVLDDLVGELLSYVRLDSEAAESIFETVNLNDLFADLIEVHAPLHPGIKFDVRNGAGVVVDANLASLSRAIENLLSNAGRFASSLIVLTASDRGEFVSIQVEDDGEGVVESDRSKVFEPFVRLENNKTEKGAGLGLALVKRIAISHGGDVFLTSNEPHGARFQIQLPKSAQR